MFDKNQNQNQNKDVYGEVFTPPVLIHELLDNLPKHVWKTPNLRWLDPCSGKGNFFDEVIPRLMTGLHKTRNEVLSMLTMIEINPDNVKELQRKYGKSSNIICGDFLDNHIVPVEGDSSKSYDVILGNPPYQSPKHEIYEGSKGNHTLWDAFVKKAFQISSSETVYGWITPSNWRRPGHHLYPLLMNRLHYLHIYNKASGRQYFGVQTRFDIYILHGEEDASRPIPLIIDEQGNNQSNRIVPRKWPFLPNFAYTTIQRILVDPMSDSSIKVIHDSSTYDARKLTKKMTSKHNIQIVHTLTREGIGLRYADHKDMKHFVPKVILNLNEKQYPINDVTGKYGMSQLSFGIPIHSRSEGDKVIRCIESPIFQEILQATKWMSFQTDHRMFSFFHRKFYDILEGNKSKKKTISRRKPKNISTKRMV